MLGVLKKDAYTYLLLMLILSAFTGLTLSMDGMDRGAVMLMGTMSLILVLGATSISEQNEDKMGGYRLLGTLPITVWELVSAKFLLAFVFGILNLSVGMALIHRLAPSSEFLILARFYLWACTFVGLTLAGLVFVGVFYGGFGKFLRLAMRTLPAIVVIIPIIVRRFFWEDIVAIPISSMVTMADSVHWGILMIFGTMIYGCLLLLAVWTKKNYAVA
ncbi:MAG: hypothetical protein HOH43_04170 [Candidatus Latescibacteria bacterium]|jgi:hypothetical protein|nr:hypothetical protein [Candidatus Latescibacterota bacterium]